MGAHAGYQNDLPLRTGDQNIESAPATLHIYGAEIQAQVTIWIFAVTHTYDHRVPLVTLDVFQRLHEIRFGTRWVHKRNDVGTILHGLGYGVLNRFPLLCVHRDYSERTTRVLGEVLNHDFRGVACLASVSTAPSPVPNAVGDVHELHPAAITARTCGGERN